MVLRKIKFCSASRNNLDAQKGLEQFLISRDTILKLLILLPCK